MRERSRPLTLSPLKQRIVDLLRAVPERRMSYYELATKLWPPNVFPKAWNYSSNGGPHGWAMPLGRALRELRDSQIAQELPSKSCGHNHGDVVLMHCPPVIPATPSRAKTWSPDDLAFALESAADFLEAEEWPEDDGGAQVRAYKEGAKRIRRMASRVVVAYAHTNHASRRRLKADQREPNSALSSTQSSAPKEGDDPSPSVQPSNDEVILPYEDVGDL